MSSILKGIVDEGDVIQGPWKNPVATQKTKAAELASEFLSSEYAPNDLENEDIENVAEYIVEFLLKYHEELTDNMDIDDIDTLAKRISREAFVQADLLDEALEENLNKWFKEKWVRFGPDGKIRGACARGSDSEGKPKCLPQSKAHSLGKKGRKYAASKKRREDPNPERTGKAKNVATKKKTNEEQLDELKCWSGYTRVQGVPAGAPGSCKKKTNEEASEKCPHCGGELVSEEMMNEKQDACYRKVKSRYKVWPSAYASGALVQCRKKGASNWGTGGKKTESYIMKGIVGEHVPNESIEEEWTHGYGPGNTSHWSGSVNKGKYTHDGQVVAKFESFEHPSTFSQSHIKVEFLPTGKVKQFSNTRSGFNKAEKWVLDSLGVGQTESIVGEASSPAQQAAIAVNMKKQGKKPKSAKFTESKRMKFYDVVQYIVDYIGPEPSESQILDAVEYQAKAEGIDPSKLFDAVCNRVGPFLPEDYTGEFAAEKTPKINPYGGRADRQFRGAISETPSTNPTGASGEGGWRKYKPKSAGTLKEDGSNLEAFLSAYPEAEEAMRNAVRHFEYAYDATDHVAGQVLHKIPYSEWRKVRQDFIDYFVEHGLKPDVNEDTAYAGGMGQGGNAGQSYRKFTPKMAGVVKKESAIMKGLRKEGR